MKLALVYDRVNKFGGAERVLSALHELWPQAPLYTAVYDARSASWANAFDVCPSFLQKIPFAKKHHEWFAWATPIAFESFSFDGYDVVISVTSAEAKTIITKPGTLHVCYCLTPTRYLWSGTHEYMRRTAIGLPTSVTSHGFTKFLPVLRHWDMLASSRPDAYIAISNFVSKRITQYYRRQVERVIYPPIDTEMFNPKKKMSGEYFLTVSRLVGYKRVDLVIQTFNKLGWPLIVIGDGYEYPRLKKMAHSNITFIRRHLTDVELAGYYQKSRAFVFAGSEDFGIVAAEAQSSGIPVIAYRNSGIAEIVVDGKTGVLFDEQSVEALDVALKKFVNGWYDSTSCTKRASDFGKSRFQTEMRTTVERLYAQYKHV